MSRLALVLAFSACLVTYGQDLKKAEELYQRTDYAASLRLVQTVKPPTAETYFLMGRNYFGLGQFKQATENFQKATSLDPKNSDYALWLGRTWGRRAEAASPITAPVAAGRAPTCFELAVKLDPRKQGAVNDLFGYYLNAPGMLGGGLGKSAGLRKHIAELELAERTLL